MVFGQLENEAVLLQPLVAEDFDRLFAVASDKEIWEQHPKSDRYRRDEFANYFNSLLRSNQAYLIINKTNEEIIGATCFYEYSETQKSVAIGFTFLAKAYWGGSINFQVKNLMLTSAFQYVDTVIFHVRKGNLRSQKALEKIGAKLSKEYPEPNSATGIRLEFEIKKSDFVN